MTSLVSGLNSFADRLGGLLLSDEEQRQLSTGDTDFYAPQVVIFELILPQSVTGAGGSYLFPLQLAPQSISITEPFGVESTVTQDAGLFTEVSGVSQRRIRISGHTGFWPQPFDANVPQFANPPSGRSFGRVLPQVNELALSGKRHFQHLQDHVFRIYSDHVRDPATSSETFLTLHLVTEGEAWLVTPMSFTSSRSAQQPLLYPYDIDLLVLDKAKLNPAGAANQDKSLIGAIKNAYQATAAFLTRATAAVGDLTAVQADLSRTVHSVGATLGQVNSLIYAVSQFVGGTVELVRSPYQAINSLAQACESACAVADNARILGASIYAWPRPIVQRMRAIETACEQLALASGAFVQPARSLQRQQAVATASAAATPNFASFADIAALGSAPLASDAALRAAPTQLGIGDSGYLGTTAYVVQQGDTLASLAARYLGSATQWSVIAAANGFLPPVVPSAVAAQAAIDDRPGGTILTVGQTINIPTRTAPPTDSPDVAVVGAPPTATAEEQLYGTDLRLLRREDGQLDLGLGTTDGLPDLGTVSGIDNVEQAAGVRLATERGTAQMYPQMGLQPVVGTSQTATDVAALRLRVSQALLDDARVVAVQGLTLTQQADAIVVSAGVLLRNRGQATQLNLTI